MVNWWPALVFGWPAILLAVVLSVMGILRRKPVWLAVAATVVIPFSFYLAGSPRFRWIGLAIPLLLFGASIAVYRCRPALAWFLLVPFVGVVGWLAIVVLNE